MPWTLVLLEKTRTSKECTRVYVQIRVRIQNKSGRVTENGYTLSYTNAFQSWIVNVFFIVILRTKHYVPRLRVDDGRWREFVGYR
jgi:hypothetical protein